MSLSGFTKALVVAGFSAFSSMASAGFIPPTFPGNDCSGVFNPAALRTARFRQISIRMNRRSSSSSISAANGVTFEINSGLFPTIDGSEFNFDFSGSGSTGTWTYTPGTGDPVINFFVAKGGPDFNLFSNLDDPLTDDWFTPINPNNGRLYGLSHLSFYDTGGGGQVPEPTTLLLLGAGLFAAGFARRRVKHN